MKTQYKVYLRNCFIGETYAISKKQAINQIRYRKNLMYEPMAAFKAREN